MLCTSVGGSGGAIAYAHYMDERLFRAHRLRFDLSSTYAQYPAELTSALVQCADAASGLRLLFVQHDGQPGLGRSTARLTVVRRGAAGSREVMSLNFHKR
jgi:hypothetical protein